MCENSLALSIVKIGCPSPSHAPRSGDECFRGVPGGGCGHDPSALFCRCRQHCLLDHWYNNYDNYIESGGAVAR